MLLTTTGISLAAAIVLAFFQGLAAPPREKAEEPAGLCVTPHELEGVEVCRGYANCCGFDEDDVETACAYARVNGRASCACAFGDHHVRCEEERGDVACRCE
jgi:hypothetical protein